MTRKLRWQIPLLAVAATVALGGATASAGSKAHTSTIHLSGIRTTLWTDPATTQVLLSNSILPLPTRGTTVSFKWTAQGPSLGFSFPITGGRVDAKTLAGRINHSGGLQFANLANGKTLKLTNFRIVIDAKPHLSALVNGDPKARVDILDLDLSAATVAKRLPFVKVGNVGAALNATAAGALNTSLGVSFFAPGHHARHRVRQRARRLARTPPPNRHDPATGMSTATCPWTPRRTWDIHGTAPHITPSEPPRLGSARRIPAPV